MDYRMPIYIQLQDIIVKKIEEKKYLPGEAIPSERKMAEMYGVNRMTVKRAVSKLVEKGYLERKPGSGTYVAIEIIKRLILIMKMVQRTQVLLQFCVTRELQYQIKFLA